VFISAVEVSDGSFRLSKSSGRMKAAPMFD